MDRNTFPISNTIGKFIWPAGWFLLIYLCLGCDVFVHAIGESEPGSLGSPSFGNDVQPILTRFNCNSGGCHGKLAGQNGFRLSLRGYAPDEDYRSLLEHESGRRINLIEPAKSLLLRKAAGQVSHGGGALFGIDTPAYLTLLRWIQSGAKEPNAQERQVVSIAASPAHSVLTVGQRQPVTVTATYSDGHQRDVTWLARFHSNDAAFATVSTNGEIQGLRHGEVSVVVSFQGLVATVLVAIPYPNSIPEDRYANRNSQIDSLVMNKLQSLNIPPSELCDDATFLRRTMLDMIGTLPTATEVRSFTADLAKDKRERLVDRLLERPEFADFWSLQIGDLLQNRKERDHDVLGAKGVRAMHAWIRSQVASNRPWNELVRDVITAEGSIETNPAVSYFVVTVGEKQSHESEVADSVSQAFLGMRIGCARCHNHPLEKYTQDDYYHFIAFFSQVVLDRKAPTDGTTVLSRGTPHIQNLKRQSLDVEREIKKLQDETADAKAIEEKQLRLKQLSEEIERNLQALPTVRQPRTGQQLSPQGLDRVPTNISPGSDPRLRFADWMTSPNNRVFSGAIVNRMWKHFFGVGLVESVDDLRETNPASNQPLMDHLIQEFVGAGYDLRHLMKMIVTSRTYQLTADTLPGNANDTKFYSHYYPKRLSAEVLLDAMVQTTGVPETFAGYPVGTLAKQLPGPQIESYFLTTFGRSERVTACACERSGDVTLSQLLHLQNSETLMQKLRSTEGNLQKWLSQFPSEDALIEQLYLATCSRWPTPLELEKIRLAFVGSDRTEVATDLYWALLNSKEFTFNH